MKKIILTTGDHDGIGFEVAAKALSKIGPKRNVQFILWRSTHAHIRFQKLLRKPFKISRCSTLREALETPSNINLVEIVSKKNPALCFEESVWAAKNKKVAALVTGPLSKSTIRSAGLPDAGHTDIIKRILKLKRHIFMSFLGKEFSLILLTDHIPYKLVPEYLSKKFLTEAILAGRSFLKLSKTKNRKIGVLGLNPHAGEIKNLGDEESKIIIPCLLKMKKQLVPVHGPLVPDICFQPHLRSKYSVYIALYHDQGLIPFKLVHKTEPGVQVTLNIPFIRTSVDHGTAKDIFGQNRADPRSMMLALRKALEWC